MAVDRVYIVVPTVPLIGIAYSIAFDSICN